MKTICLIRGINVGGKTLLMADLKKILAGMGLKNVETYIQSGNAVFDSPPDAGPVLEAGIKTAILETTQLKVEVLCRSHAEWLAILAANPFDEAALSESENLYFSLLSAEPDAEAAAKLAEFRFPDEEVRLVGRTVYLRSGIGYGRAQFNNPFLEKQLKRSATTRNLATMKKLAEMSAE